MTRVKKLLLLVSIGVAVNIALAVTKLHVGLSSNSLTIMLDATNSFFDIITYAVTAIAIGVLIAPRSDKIPHGLGRSEYLASFVVAIVSAVMGGLFFMRSLNRMAMPEPVWFGAESCALIAAAVPVKLALGIVYHTLNKRLRSKALEAIALDSFLDTGITFASLICFVITSRVDYAVDAVFGMALSVVVIIFAIKMIVDSVKAIVVGDRDGRLEELAEAAKRVFGDSVVKVEAHDYGYGEKVYDVHVAFDREVTVQQLLDMKLDMQREFAEDGGSVNIVPERRELAEQEDVSEQLVDSAPQEDVNALDEMSNEMPDEMSNEMPDIMPDDMPYEMPDETGDETGGDEDQTNS